MEGLQVEQSMTTPSKPGKQPRPVWVVSGDVAGLEDTFRELGGRKYRGAWSFFSDPSAELAELTDEDRNTFADQRANRVER